MLIKHIKELEKNDNLGKRIYIKNFLFEIGAFYSTQKFRGLLGTNLRGGENIIVDYPFSGKEISRSSKKILLTAHYDAVLFSSGANDNASGVAVLLEIISKLKKTESKNTNLRFIFFDSEEPPFSLRGSNKYIKKFGVLDIDRVYNLDMVGMGDILMLWFDDRKESILSPWVSPLFISAEYFGMPTIRRPAILRFSPFGFGRFQSDHNSFIRKGFLRACSFTVLPKEDLEFREIIDKKKFFHFAFSVLRYLLTGKGNLPKVLRHYHSKNDKSDFVEEPTLERVFAVLWKAIFLE